MKTVTSNFLTAQKKPDTFIIYRLYYKRRYWDTVSTAYIWETNWTELARDQVSNLEPIIHQFDTNIVNEFKVGNTVLHLKNDLQQWKGGSHTDSLLKPDGVTAFGYEPYLMKFQLRCGFSNVGGQDPRIGDVSSPGGSEELLTIFTGLAVDWQFDSESRMVQVYLEGFERRLLDADAEQVSTDVSLETIGTGDDVDTTFQTANNGVGRITLVTVNGVTKTPGVDYTVSNLNTDGVPATVTLTSAPAAGQLVKATYFYWQIDQTIEDLVEDLLVEAGISLFDIDNVVFPSVTTTWSQTSQADWEAGTNTLIDTTDVSGTMRMNFNSDSYRTLQDAFSSGTMTGNGWVFLLGGGNAWDWTISAGQSVATGASISTSCRKTHASVSLGTWEIKVTFTTTGGGMLFYYYFMGQSDSGPRTINGYTLQKYNGTITLQRVDPSNHVDIGSAAETQDTSQHTYRITRSPGGVFRVYRDGSLIITATDNTYTSSDRVCLHGTSSGGQSISVDDVYSAVTTQSFSSTFSSPSRDTGVGNPSAWGTVTLDKTQNDGTLTVETRVSTDNSTWDAWTAIGGSGQINSAVKRYIQVRVIFALTTGTDSRVHQIDLTYSTSGVLVQLANFTGQTVYDAISELAKLADYEWGFDDSETFFFRARSVGGGNDADFNQKNHIAQILYLRKSYETAYSVVRATFGNFVSTEEAAADSRTSLLEIIGRKVFEISSSILIAADVNIADGVAQAYFDRLSAVKRRARIRTKFWPQLELSDRVLVSFKHDPFSTPTQEPMLDEVRFKILGTHHDAERGLSEFELEEIL